MDLDWIWTFSEGWIWIWIWGFSGAVDLDLNITHTSRQTNGRTDATKYIISLASRSITKAWDVSLPRCGDLDLDLNITGFAHHCREECTCTWLVNWHRPYAIWLYLPYLCSQSFFPPVSAVKGIKSVPSVRPSVCLLYSICWQHYVLHLWKITWIMSSVSTTLTEKK